MSGKGYERRLEEARSHIRTKHYRSAVESASGGIELLMRALFEELTDKLEKGNQEDHERAKCLKYYHAVQNKKNEPEDKLTFGEWIGFFKDNDIFGQLVTTLKYPPFKSFNRANLDTIKKLRNDCSHEDYQPPKEEAEFVCKHLKMFLEETDRAPAVRQDHKWTLDHEWTKDWHKKWDDHIENWLKQEHNKEHRAQIVLALADQLRLVVDLIDDEDVPRELKTQLMWAVIYVVEPYDFISEKDDNVPALIDDAAVLALTLCWLDNNDRIDPAILREHWGREDDPIEVANKIYQDIAKNPSKYLNNRHWETIRTIAEKGPRVLWQMPK